ncbi:hypothetical protein FHS51_001380 [Sphingobium wenxiniae]|uniref:Uncharacterized protein n=1 Tax=Sphingobium wenxiniae (strain DSM 21828 / CGMCC 1.7748 / JZ-1) TaxID=595605 RepID=A0A562KKZ8_SPHWJ|nr:hypothetical protein [Sphingobium wenxiniae]MBB6191158.1 hypothetical protein [Sphingobium wenxiniae]TWH96042.1 hypothetical protein IQ35_01131 [Sphingobium wenxiniae]
MSTDHLHRPMPDAARAVGERLEPEAAALLKRAFDEVMAIEALGPTRHHDALSLMFAICASMTAKAIIMLAKLYPAAPSDSIWQAGIVDLQMQASNDFATYLAMLQEKGDRQ